jgi:hypothetical protein
MITERPVHESASDRRPMPSNFCAACAYVPALDEDDIASFGCPIHAAAPALLQAARAALEAAEIDADDGALALAALAAIRPTLRAAIAAAS